MNKKEAKEKINEMLSAGESKTSVFERLAGQGVSDQQIAYLIASYADPALCQENKGLIKVILLVTYIQLVIAVLIGFGLGLKASIIGGLIFAAFMGAFMFLFVWGFKNNRAWAYNATIMLSIIQIPNQIKGFLQTPLVSAISILLGLALIGFTWHVRQKLFPDFIFISPKKINGKYSFSN